MGYLSKFFLILLVIFSQSLFPKSFKGRGKSLLADHDDTVFPIRRIRAIGDLAHDNLWLITAPQGFNFVDFETKIQVAQFQTKNLIISTKKGFFFLNGKKPLKKQVLIYPQAGLLHFNTIPIEGSLLLQQNDDQISLVSYENPQSHMLSVARRIVQDAAMPLSLDDQIGSSKL